MPYYQIRSINDITGNTSVLPIQKVIKLLKNAFM